MSISLTLFIHSPVKIQGFNSIFDLFSEHATQHGAALGLVGEIMQVSLEHVPDDLLHLRPVELPVWLHPVRGFQRDGVCGCTCPVPESTGQHSGHPAGCEDGPKCWSGTVVSGSGHATCRRCRLRVPRVVGIDRARFGRARTRGVTCTAMACLPKMDRKCCRHGDTLFSAEFFFYLEVDLTPSTYRVS